MVLPPMSDPSAYDYMPPTDKALKLRSMFKGVLVVVSFIAVGRFIISDYWGGMNMTLMAFLGFLMLAGEYDPDATTNALLFSVMALISGIFDTIACILYFQHSKYKLMDKNASTIVLFAQCIFIISPICLYCASIVSYLIFAEFQRQYEDAMPMMQSQGARDTYYDPNFERGYDGGSHIERALRHAQAPAPVTYGQPGGRVQPFQGRGSRLD